MENKSDKDTSSDVSDNEDPAQAVIQRLEEFSYYLTQNVEKNLEFCLTLLEDRSAKKSNSDLVSTLSSVASPIPYIGKGLSSALAEGEIFILNKIDKKNSRKVADLVYFFNDNKETMRQLLIHSSIAIFYSFESQFMKLTCDGGPRRAMQKLAKDASNRIFTYFLEKKQGKDISAHDFSRGVIFGDSLKNKFMIKSGKSVKNSEKEEWKTSGIYKKVGLFFEKTDEFFSNEETKTGKYGYRRAFEWENLEEIRENWSKDVDVSSPQYYLTSEDFPQLVSEIREYIMKKTYFEEAMLDREKKHENLLNNHQAKHEEMMKTVLEQFRQVLDYLETNYEEIKINHQTNENLSTIITEQKVVLEEKHQKLNEKLTEIHTEVLETKQGQIVLHKATENIQNEISEIKNKQEEIANIAGSGVIRRESVTLSDLIKDNYEVKKVVKIVAEVTGSASQIESKARKEVKKLTKIFKR